MIFRRDHAITHKHQRRFGDRDGIAGIVRREIDDIVEIFRRQRPALGVEGKARLGRVQLDINGGNTLEIAAMIARLQPDALHLVRDPLCCRLAVR